MQDKENGQGKRTRKTAAPAREPPSSFEAKSRGDSQSLAVSSLSSDDSAAVSSSIAVTTASRSASAAFSARSSSSVLPTRPLSRSEDHPFELQTLLLSSYAVS